MKTTKKVTIDCSIEAVTIVFESENGTKWLWGKGKSHDPADRCGQPYTIHDICEKDTTWDKWFIFTPADSFFPGYYAVCGQSFDSAYEEFVDWKEEYFRIDESDLADYEDCNYSSSGVPVDTESIHGFEVRIVEVRTT